jgi:DNA polymerase-3 subunit delta'
MFIRKPANSLLVLGRSGSGKTEVAMCIADDLLDMKERNQLTNYPYFLHVKKPDDRQEISIDNIRTISRFLRLRTPGSDGIRRIIFIENAQHLSVEAQNALLKMLEEPNDDTAFILTAPHKLSLLPTIVSRCQHLWINPITIKRAEQHYQGQYSQKQIEAAWRLSQGSSALLRALLHDDSSHPLKQAVETAKSYLAQTTYERLILLDRLSKNKDDLERFLEALSKVLAALHQSAIKKSSVKQAVKLQDDRKLVQKTQKQFDTNANLRLIVLSLNLNLRT